jgi:lipopolysaccharide/colanic/teichoic acid biosynthesis glycosyltransferase
MDISADSKPNVINALQPLVGSRDTQFHSPFAERRFVLVAVDSIIVICATIAALLLWQFVDSAHFATLQAGAIWFWFPLLLGLWLMLSWLNDLYDIPSSTDRAQTARRIAAVTALVFVAYLTVFFLAPRQDLPRLFFVSFLLLTATGVAIWRWSYATRINRSPQEHRVVILGNNSMGRTIADVLSQASQVKYRLMGFVTVDAEAKTLLSDQPIQTSSYSGRQHFHRMRAPQPGSEALPVLGQQTALARIVQHYNIREVVVAVEHNLSQETFQALLECQATGVRVSYMPDLYQALNHSIPVEYINPSWALNVIQDRPVFDRVQLGLKRLFDLTVASAGLLLFAPFFPLVALAIKLDSPGSIFYRQIRCGRAGQPFTIYKFRTMTSDAERDGKARWATRGDARITRVGAFMRKTRIDELPQLINVLRGEMSFVGPRPERPEFISSLQKEIPFYYTRLMVKPGITGWAQTHYDYGNTVEDALIKLQYDFYYLRYWSVWLDLYIIFQTFKVVLKFKGI